MDLETFISNSLKAVIKGIADTKDYAIENGALINPYVGNWDLRKSEDDPIPIIPTTYFGNQEGARRISKIKFDIAVTVSNSSEINGGGGINVHALKLGGNAKSTEEDASVSRIQFDLDLVLPNTDPEKLNKS